MYDCIVAGGGPVGCYCSQKIAAKGFNVALYEEHPEIGKPLKCAGLVTPRVLKQVGISDDSVILNRIKGANIYGPNDEVLTIGGDRLHAFVIDRILFDQQIGTLAKQDGVIIKISHEVTGVSRSENSIICSVKGNGSQYAVAGSLLIGADGPNSKIRKTLQFPEPQLFLRGIGAELSGLTLDEAYVDIIVDRKFAPGFFAWIIPTNEKGTEARIGLCIPDNYSNHLKRCFKNLLNHPLLKGGKIHDVLGGSIPLGPLKRTTQTRSMLVGDAAAQVKPTSGGGLYPGLFCAQYCSDIAIKSLETQQFDNTFLKKYHILWKKNIGKELIRGMYFLKAFAHLNNNNISEYLHLMNNSRTLALINKVGDIDYPSRLIRPLITTAPTLMKTIPYAFLKSFL